MLAKIKMGSGKFLLVLKRYNIADTLTQAFDSRLIKKKIMQKMSFLPKSQFFGLQLANFDFFGKNCWIMFIHIILHQKSGSPQDFRYDPNFQHL